MKNSHDSRSHKGAVSQGGEGSSNSTKGGNDDENQDLSFDDEFFFFDIHREDLDFGGQEGDFDLKQQQMLV
jgi:hypothetical protein